MKFCRINLSKTNYTQLDNCQIIKYPDIKEIENIYRKYCLYKNFGSVMPIFDRQLVSPNTELLGYYHNGKMVAFTLLTILDSNKKHIESTQFAWDYENPELYLGLRSIENECARYKSQGFEYMYLGQVAEYKTKFDGYEQLGNFYV